MTTMIERAATTDLLRIATLTTAHVEQVLDLAAQMKAKPYTWINALSGHSLACFFEKPSTRTRVSFAAAAYQLGMLPIMLRPDELQLGRGEPIADTARVLSSYADAIVIRTFAQHTLEEMAAAADVETLARRIAAEQGGSITLTSDPRAAVVGADAVYTDVWVSMGEEAEQARRLHDLAPYQISAELMALAQPHAVFMHCLPAHRGQEVAAEVIDGPASAVWEQAANRMPTEQAVIYLLITQEWRST